MDSTYNRKVVLAVLVTVMVACALILCELTHDPPKGVGEAAKRPAVAVIDNTATESRSMRLPEPELHPPEPTTVTITSHALLREASLPQTISVTGERLVRELQRELKRVGCYSHEINGDWSPVTRRAMKDFTDRVNAVLPLGTPDAVMLALLRTHAEIVCGGACPAGQSLARDDRCIPNALLAAKSKKIEMTEVAPPSISAPATAPVARARRSAVRHSTQGSGFFAFLGW
jgi:peptidoglycan hydrolase-like protein with peptidoglycan-binding domain